MTKRHNNVWEIISQAIQAANIKSLTKSNPGLYLHWNQELRLPDGIHNPKGNPKMLDKEVSSRRPVI